MSESAERETAYERMGRRWLGLGNIDAPVWFIGLEPGGTERSEWAELWQSRYGGAEVIDGRGEAGDPDHDRWFSPTSKLQPTWGPLIRLRLAYAGEPADTESCERYQRERWVSETGREAVLELAAYAASNLGVASPRERYLPDRVARLRELVLQKRPEIVVCYGLTRRPDFETICGGPFDEDGLRWCGPTLCAITVHPTPRFRPAEPPEYWIELGRKMRRLVDERRSEA